MTHRKIRALLASGLAGLFLAGSSVASVTFFSEKAIEDVAAKLKVPEGATIDMPVDTAARTAELAAVMADLEVATAQLRMREPIVFRSLPAFLKQVDDLHTVMLSSQDRAALVAGGVEGLQGSTKATFQAKAAPMANMNAVFRVYFETYDRYQRGAIRAQIYAATLEAMLRREQLEGKLSARKLRKLDIAMAKVVEYERRYRIFTTHPKAKNHHKALSAIVIQRRGAHLLKNLEKAMAKAGMAPKRTWQSRFRGLGRELKSIVQATKAGLASAPGAARTLAYLYNPFRKEPNPKKALKAMRSMSKGFRIGTGMKLEVVGDEQVPQDRPVVFAFSHRSEVEDAILMLGATPGNEYSFMMGQWAFPSFLSTKLAEEPTSINVGGKHKDGTPVNAVGESVQTLKDGRDLVIFPEGMTPTDQGETQPLRRGLDVITKALAEQPVAVVGVSLSDPANRPGGPPHVSMGGKTTIRARFYRPLDPLMLANSGAGSDLMRNLLRVQWHQDLFGDEGSVKDLDIPDGAIEAMGAGY